MPPHIVYLPNGQTVTVSSIFGGFGFKSNDLNISPSDFPAGWSIFIESSAHRDFIQEPLGRKESIYGPLPSPPCKYTQPTLQNDSIFISSISNPSSSEFKPAQSQTRQIAMMLWITLWWYFHQPAPNPHLTAGISSQIPEDARPKGQWRIKIKREGVMRGKNLLPKLERMGLIASEESSVGTAVNDRSGEGWQKMFVSQQSFWQLDPRIYLFTLSPTPHSPFAGNSPYPSRPGSPNRDITPLTSRPGSAAGEPILWPNTPQAQSPGPFSSGSHLPTYFPPPPPQFTFTNNIRHPIRPKPYAQGVTFYTRYIPSLKQYLSFRTASLSTTAPLHRGPTASDPNGAPNFLPPNSALSHMRISSLGNLENHPCDAELLHDWMNQPRVDAVWGSAGPLYTQEKFLTNALSDNHSFPVIGCWDGKPFGYFEIYWVKEDPLGRHIRSRETSHWDRGFHALVGEKAFRGPHRVKVWLSALVHALWLMDNRTERIMLEPRIDNQKFINYLEEVGFYKEKEIAFPHKQAALMKIGREAWQAPEL